MAILWSSLVGHTKQRVQLQETLNQKRLAPVLLFAGPAGVGKKLCALSVAQTLMCDSSDLGVPCGHCSDCFQVAENKSENVLFMAPKNLTEELKREKSLKILHFLFLKGLRNKPRVIIVDQVDKMNVHAGNSLLKILEEPPEKSFFIFLTDRLSSLLPTLRSRSQVLKFGCLKKEELEQVLQSWPSAPSFSSQSKKSFFVSGARGSLEKAQVLMEESLRKKAFLTLELSLVKKAALEAFEKVEKDIQEKEKSLILTWFWQQIFRDLCFCQVLNQPLNQSSNEKGKEREIQKNQREENVLIHSDHQAFLRQISGQWPLEFFIFLKDLAFQLEKDILKHNINRPLSFKNYFNQIQNGKWKNFSTLIV